MSRTFVITVSGSRGGAGKTRLIEKLLPRLADCAAVKVHAGAAGELSVVEEEDAGESAGKDTGRFLAAGARRAFFIHGPFEDSLSAVREIIESGRFRTVAVESNAMARALDADLSFFVSAEGATKPGADECRRRADVVVSAVSGGKGIGE